MLRNDTARALVHRDISVVTLAVERTHEVRLALLAAAGHEVKKRQLFRGESELLEASHASCAGVPAVICDASWVGGVDGRSPLPSLDGWLFTLARTSVLVFEPSAEPGIAELVASLARDCGVPRVVGLATQVSQTVVRQRLRAIQSGWGDAPVLTSRTPGRPVVELGSMLAGELSAHLAPRPVPEGPLLLVPSRFDSEAGVVRASGWAWRGELAQGQLARLVGVRAAHLVEVVDVEPDVAVRVRGPVIEGQVFTSGGQTLVVERAGASFSHRDAKLAVGDLYCFGARIGRVRLEADAVIAIEGGLVVEWSAPFCVVHRTGFHQPPSVSFGRWA